MIIFVPCIVNEYSKQMFKAVKDIVFYAAMLTVFGSLMYLLAKMGGQLETAVHTKVHADSDSIGFLTEGFRMFTGSLSYHVHSSIAMLLLQIIAILFIARIFGWLFTKIGQPSVIGEIVAGIVMGPSLFAQVAPDTFAFLFPPGTLGNIDVLSQIGLILFMFAIGMELDLSEVKKSMKQTVIISHTGIVLPFFCGMLTAYLTYPSYASATTPFLSYALFIGISMSITAFPVLARIIQERGFSKTRLGTLTLASAANGDITAWCLLAMVIAIAQSGTVAGAMYVIIFSALFVLFMFFVMRPFFHVIGHIYHNKEVLNKTVVAFMLFFLIAFSYTTEILGIHALFGAFLTGVIMPDNIKFRKIMTEKVEDVSLSIFLPLFFVSTGLKTQIGLISSGAEWLLCLFFILFAIAGKVLGTAAAARYTGETWHNSWTMGALMNTRGLMELIVLTIGYEMAIIPPAIFVMLVIMTLVTTFITTPLMSFINLCFRKKERTKAYSRKKSGYLRILLSFGRASSGGILLNVASQLFSKGRLKPDITALHITVGTDVNPIHTENFEEESFEPIRQEQDRLKVNIRSRYEVANDAGAAIVNVVNGETFDFLLVGSGISLSSVPEDMEAARYHDALYRKYWKKLKAPESLFYPGDLLKDKTKMFIEQTNCTVGVFVNRNFEKADRVLVVLDQPSDVHLLRYARNLVKSNQADVSVLTVSDRVEKDARAMYKLKQYLLKYPSVRMMDEAKLSKKMLSSHNFMLIVYETWNRISEEEKDVLQQMPSTLIIHQK
jgi:Kef-type K+ transport system membrane component KefB